MTFARRRRLLAAGLLALVAPATAALAAPRADFVGHRAVYEMRLDDRSDRGEVADVSGRFVYEFSGSRCEGWASRFRFVTRLDGADGRARVTDLRTSSFEAADGRSFDFFNENWIDQKKVEESKGRARRDETGISLRLERPQAKDLALAPAVKFPTEHLAAIVAAAEAGRTIAEIDLYDGSETGEKTYRTTVVIGREATGADEPGEEPAALGDLLEGHRRWPVDVSFFDLAKTGGTDALPDYRLSFLLYDNGVSRRLRLDYGSFALKGVLSSLEALPAAPCP